MSEYTFELYKNSDAEKVIALFSKCFGKERGRDEWLWQYHHCPYGQGSVVCKHGSDLAGFYGVIRRPLFIHQKEVMSGHILDVMTHPDHQGKGLFTSAARAAFEKSRSGGIKLFFGWPNKKALPGHQKVNWRELGSRDILKHPLKSLQGDEKQNLVEKSTWEEGVRLSTDLDDLFRLRVKNSDIIADRRWSWLHWRYALRPGFGYFPILCRNKRDDSLDGLAVLRMRQFEGRKIGHIVDYLTRPGADSAIKSLESWALNHFAHEGCAFAQCLENNDAMTDVALWQSEPERELPFIIRSTDDSGSDTPTTELKEWYLTLGDCDVF